jgi:hypothetical protein
MRAHLIATNTTEITVEDGSMRAGVLSDLVVFHQYFTSVCLCGGKWMRLWADGFFPATQHPHAGDR